MHHINKPDVYNTCIKNSNESKQPKYDPEHTALVSWPKVAGAEHEIEWYQQPCYDDCIRFSRRDFRKTLFKSLDLTFWDGIFFESNI
jgi:hypothetical protein